MENPDAAGELSSAPFVRASSDAPDSPGTDEQPGTLTDVGLPARPISAKDVIGRNLGPYRLDKKIGQGGMGAVFLAYDSGLDRTVAVKVLTLASNNSVGTERFLREARHLAKLKHPNLLHVYNVGRQNDTYYFAMEYLAGDTLSRLIRAQPGGLPLAQFLPLAAQILSALYYVHSQGIVHRDIKSGNIMVCDRRAVLMDFGLAKEEGSSQLTGTGIVLGTPDYLAPEQAEGGSIGPWTDLYCFGVVMYEALNGKLPFQGRSAIAIIRQHLEASPPPMAGHLPSGLDKIVMRCLAKNPQDRFADCPALAVELFKLFPILELKELAQRANSVAKPSSLPVPSTADRIKTTVLEDVSRAPGESPPSKRAWFWALVGFSSVLLLAAIVLIFLKHGSKSPSDPPGLWLRSKTKRGPPVKLLEFDSQKGVFIVKKQQPGGAWLLQEYAVKEFRDEFGVEFDAVSEEKSPAQ